jgi:hypothetical protein
MAGRAAAGDIDVVLSCTDPPLLPWWLGARLPADRHWVEWSMDLYPDAVAAALGLVTLVYAGNLGRAHPVAALEWLASALDPYLGTVESSIGAVSRQAGVILRRCRLRCLELGWGT